VRRVIYIKRVLIEPVHLFIHLLYIRTDTHGFCVSSGIKVGTEFTESVRFCVSKITDQTEFHRIHRFCVLLGI
jgi:hypothetical protein